VTVEITALYKSYGETSVLHDLTMNAHDGEFLTLLGPSGCGKTTTLRCVAGLEKADGGRISIGGRVVAAPAEHTFVPANKRDIGMVFQSYALWPHMTVFGNVAYPLRMQGSDRAMRRTRVMEMLEVVEMERFAQCHVTELSGGQQQRVALARAMVSHPKLLLFDEPLSNLDAKLRRSTRRQIRQAHDISGATSIYVTHDQEEAIMLSDRVVVLRDGEIQQMGTPREIYREPANSFVADFVGFDNLLIGHATESRDESCAILLDGTGQPVWADLGQRADGGAAAVLAVRAENLTIHSNPTADGPQVGSIPGTVRTRSYTGQHTEYVVDIGSQSVLVRVADDATREHPVLTPGSEATVHFDPTHCVVVPDPTRGRTHGTFGSPANEGIRSMNSHRAAHEQRQTAKRGH